MIVAKPSSKKRPVCPPLPALKQMKHIRKLYLANWPGAIDGRHNGITDAPLSLLALYRCTSAQGVFRKTHPRLLSLFITGETLEIDQILDIKTSMPNLRKLSIISNPSDALVHWAQTPDYHTLKVNLCKWTEELDCLWLCRFLRARLVDPITLPISSYLAVLASRIGQAVVPTRWELEELPSSPSQQEAHEYIVEEIPTSESMPDGKVELVYTPEESAPASRALTWLNEITNRDEMDRQFHRARQLRLTPPRNQSIQIVYSRPFKRILAASSSEEDDDPPTSFVPKRQSRPAISSEDEEDERSSPVLLTSREMKQAHGPLSKRLGAVERVREPIQEDGTFPPPRPPADDIAQEEEAVKQPEVPVHRRRPKGRRRRDARPDPGWTATWARMHLKKPVDK
jgi:hypothetical protein